MYECFYQMIQFLFLTLALLQNYSAERSFTLDKANNQFLKDGNPYRYISSSVHYFRVPSAYWEDRLKKLKYLGLNAVQTYVAWNYHEISPGQYNFIGDRNFFEYLKVANDTGLDVVLRPGPYIDAEWDMGGLPYWLLKNRTIVDHNTLRTADPGFYKHVKNWYDYFLPLLVPYLHKNGGPIITVQVENEYGSYFACDYTYLDNLVSLIRHHLGDDVVLFTTDGDSRDFLRCGKIPGIYASVDFGAGADVAKGFEAQRSVEPDGGPLINSEFYVGWIDHWGYPHSRVAADRVTSTLGQMLDTSNTTCVNLYLAHGGTSFAFWNGAETSYAALNGAPPLKNSNLTDYSNVKKDERIPYFPNPTSYDFDGPINEGGDLTPKYFAIRETIAKYKTIPDGDPPIHDRQGKVAYGALTLNLVPSDVIKHMEAEQIKLFQAERNFDSNFKSFTKPPTFEELDHPFGYVVYTHYWDNQTDPIFYPDPDGNYTLTVEVPGIADRAYVTINGNLVAVFDRMRGISNVTIRSSTIPIVDDTQVRLVIENQGRVCYGSHINDAKGMPHGLRINGALMENFDVYPVNFTHSNEAITDYLLAKLADQANEITPLSIQKRDNTQWAKLLNIKPRTTRTAQNTTELLKNSHLTNNYFEIRPKVPSYCPYAYFVGHFVLPPEEFGPKANDTYLDMDGWFKGAAFLNGHNLGRYWTSMGPHRTLYVPGVYFKPNGAINVLVLFETESQPPCNFPGEQVNFVDKPVIFKSHEYFAKNIGFPDSVHINNGDHINREIFNTHDSEFNRDFSSNDSTNNINSHTHDKQALAITYRYYYTKGKLCYMFRPGFWYNFINALGKSILKLFHPYLSILLD